MTYAPCMPGYRRHWGRSAAGLACWSTHDDQAYVLLTLRSRHVQAGGTWSVPGGAVEPFETTGQAALRETREELAGLPWGALRAVQGIVRHCQVCHLWTYSTFLAQLRSDGRLPRVSIRRSAAWETSRVAWVAVGQVADLDLHPGFAAAWPALQAMIPVG